MPAHEGLWPDNRHGLEDRRKPAIQLDEEQAIAVGELDAAAQLALQHCQLKPERGILCFKSALGLEKQAARFTKRNISATIVADVKRFSYQINTDEVFGTHNREGGISIARAHRCQRMIRV